MKATTPLLTLLLLLAACHGPQPQTAVSDTVTDDYGRSVVVPTQPRRVVSLSPAVTEIMFALGAGDLLVGRTDFCAYPPEAADIPSIGGISNLSIERIVSMQPDLVVSGSMVSKKATDQMDQLGVPMVCVIEKPCFDALYDNILAIGRLVGKEKEADSLVAALHQRVDSELQSPDSEPGTPDSPKVYYVVGYGPTGNFTAGGNTFINDIIRMAGGRNIAEEVEGWSYSLEALVHEDPDFIIVRREDSASFVSMKPYNTLRAVRQGHVIGIVSGTLDLQVPRNIDAVLYLRHRMQTAQ
ncbi:MAG: ABC transporter substrate-binding protein [Bacteroidales bacterium]|nr:ABC transporter substrate-binding protein [Bacteroidales bacterium]